MRYASLLLCVFALFGCKSAEQVASDNAASRARIAANTKEMCASLGYPSGSIEQARCAEGLVKKMFDEEAAGMQGRAIIAAAQARNRVSCMSYGNTVNCY